MEQAALLPKPEVRGTGTIVYRCASCKKAIADDELRFSNGVIASPTVPSPLTENVRTYHYVHLPEGVTDGR